MFGSEFEAGLCTEIGFDGIEDVEFWFEIGGVVGGTNEGAGGAVAEAFGDGNLFIFGEFIRVDEVDDWKMFRCGAEVLAEGEDSDVVGEEVVHGGEDFLMAFAEAEHDAGFGGDVATDHFLGLFQDGE